MAVEITFDTSIPGPPSGSLNPAIAWFDNSVAIPDSYGQSFRLSGGSWTAFDAYFGSVAGQPGLGAGAVGIFAKSNTGIVKFDSAFNYTVYVLGADVDVRRGLYYDDKVTITGFSGHVVYSEDMVSWDFQTMTGEEELQFPCPLPGEMLLYGSTVNVLYRKVGAGAWDSGTTYTGVPTDDYIPEFTSNGERIAALSFETSGFDIYQSVYLSLDGVNFEFSYLLNVASASDDFIVPVACPRSGFFAYLVKNADMCAAVIASSDGVSFVREEIPVPLNYLDTKIDMTPDGFIMWSTGTNNVLKVILSGGTPPGPAPCFWEPTEGLTQNCIPEE